VIRCCISQKNTLSMQRPTTNHSGTKKPFSSSAVSAEYKAALQVFNNNTILTEACQLLLPPPSSSNANANVNVNATDTNTNTANNATKSSEAKFQSLYQKCFSAYETISRTEAKPGFLKTFAASQWQSSSQKKTQQPHRPTSMSAMSAIQRKSSFGNVHGATVNMNKHQHQHSHALSLSKGSLGVSIIKTGTSTCSTSSSISNLSTSAAGNAAGSDSKFAPPKSAVKFLEALNAKGGGGGNSNVAKRNMEKDSRNTMAAVTAANTTTTTTTASKKRRKHEKSQREEEEDEEEEEFQEDVESSSSESEEEPSSPRRKSARDRRQVASKAAVKDRISPSPRRTARGKQRTTPTVTEPSGDTPQVGDDGKARGKKRNAPTEPSGDKFQVGDDVLVYFPPDDKWYEAIVSNVNHSEKHNDNSNDANGKESDRDTSVKPGTRTRRSGRNRGGVKSANTGDEELVIGSYDCEYDNGEHQENVIPLHIQSPYMDS